MTPERIHDALNLLPEELLEATDALRRRQPKPWSKWLGLAACLVLVAGIGLLSPALRADKEDAPAQEDTELTPEYTSEYSQQASTVTATVLQVYEDYANVVIGEQLDLNGAYSLAQQTRIYFTKLESVPTLVPGQFLRIYIDTAENEALMDQARPEALYPQRIEIVED